MKILVFKIFFPLTLAFLLNVFEGHAHVQLDLPRSGEYFLPGQTITVKWHLVVAHPQNNWDIFMSFDGGVTWSVLKADLPVIQTEYRWVVPAINTNLAKIKIVQDNSGGSNYESSSGNFTISDEITGLQNSSDQISPRNKIFKIPNENSLVLQYDIQQERQAILSIFNLSGQLVFNQNFDLFPGRKNERRIMISPLKRGMYVYQIIIGNDYYSDKIFID